MTLLLSFTVIQAQVIDSIPKTPQDVILNILVQGEAVFAMAITGYACFICAWADSYDKTASQMINLCFCIKSIRFCRLIDFLIFAFFLTAQIIFNIFMFHEMFHVN